MGGLAETQAFFRFFPVPGMGHCSGGAGPSSFDALAALEQWHEQGVVPSQLLGPPPDQRRCRSHAAVVRVPHDRRGSTARAARTRPRASAASGRSPTSSLPARAALTRPACSRSSVSRRSSCCSALIMSRRMSPLVALIVVPTAAALVAGFGLQTGTFILTGLQQTALGRGDVRVRDPVLRDHERRRPARSDRRSDPARRRHAAAADRHRARRCSRCSSISMAPARSRSSSPSRRCCRSSSGCRWTGGSWRA